MDEPGILHLSQMNDAEITNNNIKKSERSAFKTENKGLPSWAGGKDSTFPMQEVQVQSLIRELDLTCHI